MAFQPLVFALVDDVLGEVALAVVFEPVETNIGVGCHQVGHAVSCQIDSRDCEGVAVSAQGKVFGKFNQFRHFLPLMSRCGPQLIRWGHDSRVAGR